MLKNIVHYVKDFIGRSVYFYKKNGEYRKLTNIVGFLFVIFNATCFYAYYFCELEDGFFMSCWIFGIIFFIFGWVGESFNRFPSDFIQPDMDKLPDKIGKYSVSIQYTPPKGLNPSEVGLLFDLKSYSTNFDCLLYKRKYEGLLEIEDKGYGSVVLYKNREINDNVPSYERQYWSLIFGFEHKDRVIFKWNQLNLDDNHISALHAELLNYCVKQGFLCKNKDYLFILSLVGIFGGGFIFGYILGVIIIILSFVYIISCLGKQGKYLGTKIGRTDKGNELLAQIVGYKYWLERCEENQVKEILKQDPGFSSRNLPYIVALRMDWKFLDGKFNK